MKRNPLPPFLEKLAVITKTVDKDIANWSDDGKVFVIKHTEKFEMVLKQHFKGNVQTFIRQLHFYGFRKLDSNEGGWSFVHENFRKDCPQLLSEIRRKTRVDPTAENIASHTEVQSLKIQVAHLQDVVEDLRTQLDSVITVLDEADLAKVERRFDGKPLKVGTAGSKRPRTAITNGPDFHKICETVKPVTVSTTSVGNIDPIMISDTDIESASLGSLSETDMIDVNEMLKENVQIKSEKETSDSKAALLGHLLKTAPEKWSENQNTKFVVQTIAKATNLDHDSVSKVLRYFADSSQNVSSPTTQIKKERDLPSLFEDTLSFQKLPHLTPLPAQRVGAN